MFVTIAINNFNYGKFLRECIDSALNQSYEKVEIIVVDDGSTDNSLEIIKSYGNRITSIFKENGGQGSAYNAGFEKAKGDIIIFLDSDDLIFPDTVDRIVNSWIEDTVKVHFRLAMIDDAGNSMGANFPNFLHSGDVTGTIEKFGFYASPPGSGNAFSKRSLDKFFPMLELEWRIAADTYPIFLAPFFGKVTVLEGVGGAYRIHKKNRGSDKFVLNNSPSTPSDSVARTYQSKQLILKTLGLYSLIRAKSFRFDPPAQIKIRLISLRVNPLSHPIDNDSPLKALHDGLLAIINWPDYPLKTRVGYALWMTGVAFFPKFIAEKIILWAIDSGNQPRLIRKFLKK